LTHLLLNATNVCRKAACLRLTSALEFQAESLHLFVQQSLKSLKPDNALELMTETPLDQEMLLLELLRTALFSACLRMTSLDVFPAARQLLLVSLALALNALELVRLAQWMLA